MDDYSFSLYRKDNIYYLWPASVPIPTKGILADLKFVAGLFDIRYEQSKIDEAEYSNRKEAAKGTLLMIDRPIR